MEKPQVHIGLSNPKSPTNVGAVMRAAGCFGVDAVVYTGTRYDKAARFHTDTQNRTRSIPLTGVDDLLADVPDSMAVVCVELVEGATSLTEFQHPAHAFYIFGAEDSTLTQATIDRADAVVYIPTVGCLNLAATVNVVLYDRLLKSGRVSGGDALIRQSRDMNNRVRVRRASS